MLINIYIFIKTNISVVSMKYSFTIVIEQDEDGIYIAKVPDIPGCYTQGRTVEQVMERIKEAIQVCIEAEEDKDILPMKFVGVQQLEVKV
jgi:predicted RNase H-like HicB family nuclease